MTAETIPGLSNAEEVGDDDELDGRHARRQRNRDAVVDAMIELHNEGNYDPSSVELADRAGLSARSIFRYFDDRDDLYSAAFERQQERMRPLLAITVDADAPRAERVAAVVEQRMRVFEEIGATAFATRLRAPFQPVIEANLARARGYHRAQLRKLFSPELDAMPAAHAAAVLAALDVVCSYESYHLLRKDQGLSRPKAAAAMTVAVDALLDGAPA